MKHTFNFEDMPELKGQVVDTFIEKTAGYPDLFRSGRNAFFIFFRFAIDNH